MFRRRGRCTSAVFPINSGSVEKFAFVLSNMSLASSVKSLAATAASRYLLMQAASNERIAF